MRHLLDRRRLCQELVVQLFEMGSYLCACQRLFGDFHLKTELGFLAADCFLQIQAVERKLSNLDLGFGEKSIWPRGLVHELPGKSVSALAEIKEQLGLLLRQITQMSEAMPALLDPNLENLLVNAGEILSGHFQTVSQWVQSGPTPERNLSHEAGLYRDCYLIPKGQKNSLASTPKRDLKNFSEILAKPEYRAQYFSANAYLELTSVDILSHIMESVLRSDMDGRTQLLVDLSRQLADECRHAELLAARVEELGFELGFVPVDLHTWNLVNVFPTIAEKIVAQQVLQEAVGLDASAGNIWVMAQCGDRESAELFAQIAADERNHVELGLKWAQRIWKGPFLDLLKDVQDRCDKAEPPQSLVPTIPELQRSCGIPAEWITRQIQRCGELPLAQVHSVLAMSFQKEEIPCQM